MDVTWDSEVSTRIPDLAICIGIVNGIHVEKESETVRRLKADACADARARYHVESLKDDPTVRAYRDLYWKLDIDPTKTRPSGEALLRRVLNGNDLPNISNVVDAYNLASMKTIIPISGFDKNQLNPPLHTRFARNGETFTGIGMKEPITLTKRMLVLADANQILCIYPYRDADNTKIGEQSRNALIVGYGAPRIPESQLREAVETTLFYIKLVAGGEAETAMIFKAQAL